MIYFFRRIRKGHINKYKIGKYLLYAMGEILLVVVGILIALYINNYNSEQAIKKEITALFDKASFELERNITIANNIITNYKKKDSIFYLAHEEKLSFDDYINGEIPLNWNTTSGMLSPINHNAIFQLLDYEKEIPKAYEVVFENIKILHNEHLKRVNDILEQHTTFTINLAENQLKYSWFGANEKDQIKKKIEYYLNSPENKSWSFRYHEYAINYYARRMSEYRDLAIQIYYDLGSLLESITPSQKFIYRKDWQWIEGKWLSSIGRKSKFTFKSVFPTYNGEILAANILEMDTTGKHYRGSYNLFRDFIFFSNNHIEQQYYNFKKINNNSFTLIKNNGETVTYTRDLD